ncbi:MAG: Sua5/YciO/YrdC/YwlC family protein, partial [Thermoanaerobaculia bacterium]|nr:Sua5/YciO/YrdC/YwlC family protein [Thermoanaerobaculia bacterium]
VVADAAQAADLGIDVDSPGWRGVASHWPAPLSLVCPLAEPVAAAVGAGSLAVRVPAHPRLRRLLRDLATPLTATSANRSGEAPILDPCRVADLLAGETGAVVDDGVLPGGPPSTLVRWAAEEARYVVLREGAYPSRRL